MENLIKNIRAFIFDIDGVFTDGKVFLHSGEFIRTVNIKDGYAVQYCIKHNYYIGIISGGSSDAIKKRFNNLGVTDIYLNSSNKIHDYEDFRQKHNLKNEEILYMGDDIPDYEIMQLAGFSTSPADAAEEIKELASFVSSKNGGEGCVREVIEMVLKKQNKWLKDNAFDW